MKKIKYIALLILFVISIQSQSIYEPIEADIHNFLDRMNIKGVINLDTETKPYTRNYIAQNLVKILVDKINLNMVEYDELEWYLEEYNYEVMKILKSNSQFPPVRIGGILNSQLINRWRVLSYTDSLFQLQFSPVAGYGFKWIGNENGNFQVIGIRAFGSYGDNFSSYIHFTDNGDYGGTEKVNYFLNSDKGRETINAQKADGIEFSDVRGSITFDWKWGNISLIKDYFSWGNGYFGNTILSSKAPSYPHIRFVLKPTDWFRFYFTHGWLTSNVIDSLKSQFNYGVYGSDADVFVKKYYVANLFVFEPTDNIELMIGNSAVYSGDNIRPEFFIPFMFFKYLDRDLGKGRIEDANGQLHFGVNYQPIEKVFLYGNILFDVIEIQKTVDANNPNNWFGFTLGTKLVNLPINNLDFTLEYTRINPWVYEHKDATTTYKHLDYPLGHWIGQNADLLRIQLDFRPIRSLSLSLFFQKFRKGGLDNISVAYTSGEERDFLYGPVRKENALGFNMIYNPFHEVYLRANYKYSDITDEDPNRTSKLLLGSNNSFSISLTYGLR